MKKRICTVLVSATLLLGGCQPDMTLMNAYSDASILKDSNIVAMIDLDQAAAFSEKVAVVMEDENKIASEEPGLLIRRDTNEVIYAVNAYKTMAPASTTKMMTALVALKYYDGDFNTMLTLTKGMDVSVEGAQVCQFKPGDKITFGQVFNSMMVFSGNDAANAIALAVSGNISDFVALMNKEAQALGAINTHFENPHGLDEDNHYSCAYDLYLIFNECLKYEAFTESMKLSTYSVSYVDEEGEAVTNHFPSTNLFLLNQVDLPENVKVIGGKTGTTLNAGSCLVLLSTIGEEEYISVAMGYENRTDVYDGTNELLSKIEK